MDLEAKKRALRMISYGLYVLSAQEGEHIAAATVNWLSQASFSPPLVMVGLKLDSHTFIAVKKSMCFTVNLLGKDQKDLAQDFFRASSVVGNKINGHEFEQGITGGVVLTEAPAYFECKVSDIVERGDHAVVVGQVVEAKLIREDTPLFMPDTGWTYGG